MARNTKRRLGATLGTVLGLALGGLVPMVAAASERPVVTSRHDDIAWTSCFADRGPDFECATVKVPLDYDRPRGRRVALALVRLPAADPSARVGSLFLNPGGPGGSGVEFAVDFGPFAGLVYGPDVRARYDIVGFDPRGVARSTPLRCFDTLDEAFEATPPVAFPLTVREAISVVLADRRLARACKSRGGAIGRHMTTANVARDLDVLRARVGDEQLTYVGLSYGSFLGVTYANLFPERVGAVVVDGVLDPVAWVNRGGRVPFSTRLRSDEGAQETLEKFFSLCDEAGPRACALAPSAQERFAALADGLRAEPMVVLDPETGEEFLLEYWNFIAFTLQVLYDPFGYDFLADLIAVLEQGAGPARAGAAFKRLADAAPLVSLHRGPRDFPEQPDYVNFVESGPAVACTDSDNPNSYRAWWRAGVRAERRFGYFGRIWTWSSSACAQWPFADRDRYEGPFTAQTANPVLVVGNHYDPATRYEGAEAVRRLVPNSALLSVDMPGHTSLGLSACAGSLVGRYLLDPDFAAEVDGFTCPPEFNPFELFAARRAMPAGVQPELRREVLGEVALRPTR